MIITAKKPKSKPRKTCPKCGGKSIAKIIWGLVEIEDYKDEDNIHFGGCCIPIDENGNAPKFHCNDCEYEW